jgi:hypothetical protein
MGGFGTKVSEFRNRCWTGCTFLLLAYASNGISVNISIHRLPIIVLEDSTLHPDFGLLVWLMVAESKVWGIMLLFTLINRMDLLLTNYGIYSNPLSRGTFPACLYSKGLCRWYSSWHLVHGKMIHLEMKAWTSPIITNYQRIFH